MENRKVELQQKDKNLAELKISRGIFQEDTLLLLISVKAIMSLSYILREFTGSYKFTKSGEKNNQLMYMANINIFAKKGKRN